MDQNLHFHIIDLFDYNEHILLTKIVKNLVQG